MSDLPALRPPSVLSRTVPGFLARYRVRARARADDYALGGALARLGELAGLSLLLAVLLAVCALPAPR